MLEAISLKSIKSKLSTELPEEIIVATRVPIRDESDRGVIGFMTSIDMNQPLRYQTVKTTKQRNVKLIGILLCHPESPLGKNEILSHLSHFHIRSGEAVDFFCAGYGAFWPDNHHIDQKVVAKVEGTEWLFSDVAFSEVIDQLEVESKWRYSGETELLLVAVKKSQTGELLFSYDTAITCNLEQMEKDKAFTSVRAFFNDIFRFAKTNLSKDPSWAFSDAQGIKQGKGVLKEAVLSVIPSSLRDGYKKTRHYAVKNISTDF